MPGHPSSRSARANAPLQCESVARGCRSASARRPSAWARSGSALSVPSDPFSAWMRCCNVTSGGATLRHLASMRARCAIASRPPPRNGERSQSLAISKGSAPLASSNAVSAVATSGQPLSGVPPSSPKGARRDGVPITHDAGVKVLEKTRPTSARRCSRSGTMMRSSDSGRARSCSCAHCAADSSSDCASGKATRTPPVPSAAASQVTLTPCAASRSPR